MGVDGKTIALVMAAGSGSRTGGAIPKQYRAVAGRTLLAHAVERLRHPLIDEIRVVIGDGQQEAYAAALPQGDLPPPVIGGPTRQQSVRRGLEALEAQGAATVLIHDAARPFVPPALIEQLIAALAAVDGAVPVLPVPDTLAMAGESLGDPVERDGVVRVQTPQAFRFDAILAAHRLWDGSADATDDAQVARAAGMAVATVAGDAALEKLTYDSDFIRAAGVAAESLISRTGSGFDVHSFCEGDHVWLGGIRVTHERGLSGHSDADVALHALTDALLGAISEGDIGEHFPPSDPQWRGAASSRFLAHARDLVERRGGIIDHVDVTIICEAPRIGPHKQAMRDNIAALLGLPPGRISVKATTTERLGFAGRGEGIAAQALATVRLGDTS